MTWKFISLLQSFPQLIVIFYEVNNYEQGPPGTTFSKGAKHIGRPTVGHQKLGENNFMQVVFTINGVHQSSVVG